jgi:hypothetical protein
MDVTSSLTLLHKWRREKNLNPYPSPQVEKREKSQPLPFSTSGEGIKIVSEILNEE